LGSVCIDQDGIEICRDAVTGIAFQEQQTSSQSNSQQSMFHQQHAASSESSNNDNSSDNSIEVSSVLAPSVTKTRFARKELL